MLDRSTHDGTRAVRSLTLLGVCLLAFGAMAGVLGARPAPRVALVAPATSVGTHGGPGH